MAASALGEGPSGFSFEASLMISPGEQQIKDSKPGDRANHAIELEIGELISLFLLLKNPGGEIDRANMRAQFTHHGRATSDLLRRRGQGNSPGGRFRLGHGISFP